MALACSVSIWSSLLAVFLFCLSGPLELSTKVTLVCAFKAELVISFECLHFISNLNCLLLASQASSGLPCWLIKPCLHVVLPMFTKMFIGDNIVVLNHGALPARLLLTCSLVVVLQVEFEDYSRLNMRFCRMLSREQGFYCNYFSCQVMQKFSKWTYVDFCFCHIE